MILLEIGLSRVKFVLDEIWHDMRYLNVSHFRIQLVRVNLQKIILIRKLISNFVVDKSHLIRIHDNLNDI